MPGFVPQVTIGVSSEASKAIERSNVAPSSVGSSRQRRRPRPRRHRPERAAGRRRTRTWCRRERPCRPARRPRCSCCRSSSGLPSRAPRIAEPRYSKTWPVPPPTPMRDSSDRMMSLAVTPGWSWPSTRTSNVFGRRWRRRLGGEDVLDLGRADAERQRPERAVRGGVRVAAHDGHSRLRQAELGTDDVDDPLVRRADAVERDAELAAVLLQRVTCLAAISSTIGQRSVRGGDGVVDGGDRLAGTADAAAHARAGRRRPAGW